MSSLVELLAAIESSDDPFEVITLAPIAAEDYAKAWVAATRTYGLRKARTVRIDMLSVSVCPGKEPPKGPHAVVLVADVGVGGAHGVRGEGVGFCPTGGSFDDSSDDGAAAAAPDPS